MVNHHVMKFHFCKYAYLVGITKYSPSRYSPSTNNQVSRKELVEISVWQKTVGKLHNKVKSGKYLNTVKKYTFSFICSYFTIYMFFCQRINLYTLLSVHSRNIRKSFFKKDTITYSNIVK